MAPVSTKAARQPRCETIQGMSTGVTMAPTFVPALKRPVVKARSRFGNHSATVLIDAGKLPPSPRPKANRATPKPKAPPARAWAMAAKLHTTTERAKLLRVPMRSMSFPETSRLMA